MSVENAPYVRRASWDRGDKLVWFGGTVVYGLPCCGLGIWGTLSNGLLWAAMLFGAAWLVFGFYNWRMRARDANRLLAEITTDGLRFREEEPPIPWPSVSWVGFHEEYIGRHVLTRDYVVLQLTDGRQLRFEVDGIIAKEVPAAIARLAPQVPAGPAYRLPPERRT